MDLLFFFVAGVLVDLFSVGLVALVAYCCLVEAGSLGFDLVDVCVRVVLKVDRLYDLMLVAMVTSALVLVVCWQVSLLP